MIATYQDYLLVKDNETAKANFLRSCISAHESSPAYRAARSGIRYYNGDNETISNVVKYYVDKFGNRKRDDSASNFRMRNKMFPYFVNQLVLYLLGNGIQMDTAEKEKLGDIDKQLIKAAIKAQCGAVSYAFWNLDHVEVFDALEFVPLWDEDTGALRAGVRYWRLTPEKPLRITLYEDDGYSEYIDRNDGAGVVLLVGKQPYVKTVVQTAIDTEIRDGRNYDGFPIVPLWANENKKTGLSGLRDTIDAVDLLTNGFANTVKDTRQILFILRGAMGSSGEEKFREVMSRIERVGGAAVDDDQSVDTMSPDIAFEANQAIINMLEDNLYRDAMALRTSTIQAGNVTATQIRSAYEPLNQKADMFEMQVRECLDQLMQFAGVSGEYHFERSTVANAQESMQTLMLSAQYLPRDYLVSRILSILGDTDSLDSVLQELDAEEMTRVTDVPDAQEDTEDIE